MGNVIRAEPSAVFSLEYVIDIFHVAIDHQWGVAFTYAKNGSCFNRQPNSKFLFGRKKSGRIILWPSAKIWIIETYWFRTDESLLGFRQCALGDLISLHRASSGFASGVVLKVSDDAQNDVRDDNTEGEADLYLSPGIYRFKWPIVLLLMCGAYGLAFAGGWRFSLGHYVGCSILMVCAAICATFGALVLCLFP